MRLHHQKHIEACGIEVHGHFVAQPVEGYLASSQLALLFSILEHSVLGISNGTEIDTGHVSEDNNIK